MSFLVTVSLRPERRRELQRHQWRLALARLLASTVLERAGEKVAKLLHTLIDSLSLMFYVNQRPGFHLSVKQILGKFAKKEMTCKLNAFPPNGWSGQTTPVPAV